MKAKILFMALLCSGTAFANDMNFIEAMQPYTKGVSFIRCSDTERRLKKADFLPARIEMIQAQGRTNLEISSEDIELLIPSINLGSDQLATEMQTVLNVENDTVRNKFLSDSIWMKNKKTIVGTRLQIFEFTDKQTLEYKSIFTVSENGAVQQKFCSIILK